MSDYTTSRIDDLPDLWDGWGRKLRTGLGISAFACNIIDVPPDTPKCLDHTEEESRQEELYLALRGRATMTITDGDGDETQVDLTPETAIRVAPETRRRISTGSEGARLLVVGGVVGEAYVPTDMG